MTAPDIEDARRRIELLVPRILDELERTHLEGCRCSPEDQPPINYQKEETE